MSTADERQYKPPRITERDFNCPHCGSSAHQYKYQVGVNRVTNEKVTSEKDFISKITDDVIRNRENSFITKNNPFITQEYLNLVCEDVAGIYLCCCSSCNELSIWIFEDMIWPPESGVPRPNPDLPNDVRSDYEEASAILRASPRGAAALLRLSIQKLCKHLGESGDNLNKDISELVKKGLLPLVKESLDSVRVIGNHAVHPSHIDLQDDPETARILFDLVNIIADSMISTPNKVKKVYESLPEGAKQAIKKRDER